MKKKEDAVKKEADAILEYKNCVYDFKNTYAAKLGPWGMKKVMIKEKACIAKYPKACLMFVLDMPKSKQRLYTAKSAKAFWEKLERLLKDIPTKLNERLLYATTDNEENSNVRDPNRPRGEDYSNVRRPISPEGRRLL